jgi:hypothetical protein
MLSFPCPHCNYPIESEAPGPVPCPRCGAAAEPAPARPRRRLPPWAPWALAIGGGGLLAIVGIVAIVFWSMPNPAHGVMPLKVWMVQTGSEKATFRLACQLSTYHNFEYDDTEPTHYSIDVSQAAPRVSAHAYAARNSAIGRRLYELLKDGRARWLTLELSAVGPDGKTPVTRSNGVFAITRIVKDY